MEQEKCVARKEEGKPGEDGIIEAKEVARCKRRKRLSTLNAANISESGTENDVWI